MASTIFSIAIVASTAHSELSTAMPFPSTVLYTFCTVAMLVLFARMLKKLFGHSSRIDPHSHAVMKLVVQYTDKLRGQCLIQDIDRLRGVELIVFGHKTIGALLTCSGPNFFEAF